MSREILELNNDYKSLKRLENIINKQIKLNNLLMDNNKLRENNKSLIKENKILLDILSNIELNREQSRTVLNILKRKVYKNDK